MGKVVFSESNFPHLSQKTSVETEDTTGLDGAAQNGCVRAVLRGAAVGESIFIPDPAKHCFQNFVADRLNRNVELFVLLFHFFSFSCPLLLGSGFGGVRAGVGRAAVGDAVFVPDASENCFQDFVADGYDIDVQLAVFLFHCFFLVVLDFPGLTMDLLLVGSRNPIASVGNLWRW
jgi:hypothetical protein